MLLTCSNPHDTTKADTAVVKLTKSSADTACDRPLVSLVSSYADIINYRSLAGKADSSSSIHTLPPLPSPEGASLSAVKLLIGLMCLYGTLQSKHMREHMTSLWQQTLMLLGSAEMTALFPSQPRMTASDRAAAFIPSWAPLSTAEFADITEAAVSVLLTLQCLHQKSQDKRKHTGSHSLQTYLQLQQALLSLLANLIAGHPWNPDFDFQRIASTYLMGILRSWKELWQAELSSVYMDDLVLAVLRRLQTDKHAFASPKPGQPSMCQDASLIYLAQTFCKGLSFQLLMATAHFKQHKSLPQSCQCIMHGSVDLKHQFAGPSHDAVVALVTQVHVVFCAMACAVASYKSVLSCILVCCVRQSSWLGLDAGDQIVSTVQSHTAISDAAVDVIYAEVGSGGLSTRSLTGLKWLRHCTG